MCPPSDTISLSEVAVVVLALLYCASMMLRWCDFRKSAIAIYICPFTCFPSVPRDAISLSHLKVISITIHPYHILPFSAFSRFTAYSSSLTKLKFSAKLMFYWKFKFLSHHKPLQRHIPIASPPTWYYDRPTAIRSPSPSNGPHCIASLFISLASISHHLPLHVKSLLPISPDAISQGPCQSDISIARRL